MADQSPLGSQQPEGFGRTAQAWRMKLRDRLQGPLDPDDERHGLTGVDRAVMLVVGAVAGGTQVMGADLALTAGRPAAIAAEELRLYLQGQLEAAEQRGYDAGHGEGWAEGFAAGEATLDAGGRS